MRYKGILFDLDGTLIDSRRDLAEAVNVLRRERGLQALPIAEVASHVGDGLDRLLERCFPEGIDDLVQMREDFFEYYGSHIAVHTVLYEGVRETLEALIGFPCGVLTNKPHDLSISVLQALDLERFFTAVYGGGFLPALKPDPMGVYAFARDVGLSPKSILLVGDHVTDLETARNAGIDACFCSFGIGQAREFSPALAIDTFSDLLRIVTP